MAQKRPPPASAPSRAFVVRSASIALLVATVIAGLALSGAGSGSGPVAASRSVPLGPISAVGPLMPAPDPGPLGSENVPTPSARALAPANAIAPGRTVDGISSAPLEQLVYHIHVHLTIFVNGVQRQIPYGVGIAPPIELQQTPQGPFVAGGRGFTWLHTHAADGIIHVESPVHRTYTLGNFFDIWHQPLGAHQVGPATGPVTAFFDGRHYLGNPRNIPLLAHAQIQLEVGRPLIAPESIQFPAGL